MAKARMLAIKGLTVLTGALRNSIIFREMRFPFWGDLWLQGSLPLGNRYITSLSVSDFLVMQNTKLRVPIELPLEGGGLYLRVAHDIIIFSTHFSISTPHFACIALIQYDRITSSLDMNTSLDLKSPNELLCLKHE
jgi:hypothetical protein